MLYATMHFIYLWRSRFSFSKLETNQCKTSLKICTTEVFSSNFHMLKILTYEICQNHINGEELEKMKVSGPRKQKLRQGKCSGGKACKAIFWPIPGFKRKTFISYRFSTEGTLISTPAARPSPQSDLFGFRSRTAVEREETEGAKKC